MMKMIVASGCGSGYGDGLCSEVVVAFHHLKHKDIQLNNDR